MLCQEEGTVNSIESFDDMMVSVSLPCQNGIEDAKPSVPNEAIDDNEDPSTARIMLSVQLVSLRMRGFYFSDEVIV